MITTHYPQQPQPQPSFTPFVFIVDSPSAQDLYQGYTIGMALRDALTAIRIPCVYKLTVNLPVFQEALGNGLRAAIDEHQVFPNTSAHPIIHLCMHGAEGGVIFTNEQSINWQSLRQILLAHDVVQGHPPFLCMASCKGLYAVNMASAFDSAFSFLVGNAHDVLQSDLTVGYLAFYHHLFVKNANIDQSLIAMKNAAANGDFFFYSGEQIKHECIQQIMRTSKN